MNRVSFTVLMFFLVFYLGGCSYFGETPEKQPEEVAVKSAVVPEVVAEVAEPVAAEKPQMFEPGSFESPERCKNCHSDIYKG